QSVPISAFEVMQIQPGFTVTGPTSGAVGQPVTYTISRVPANDQNYDANIYGYEDGVFLKGFGGAHGGAAPLTPATPIGTVTYTPSTPGVHTLSFLPGGQNWVLAPNITFTTTNGLATSYQIVAPGPAAGLVGQPSGAF